MSATVPPDLRVDATARPEGQARGALPRTLRLRSHGVTPLFVLTLLVLTLLAQVSGLAFLMLLMHMGDGVVETRNSATLTAFALIFMVIVVVGATYDQLRQTMVSAVAERFGLRLRAEALQAAIRRAVTTDTAEGVALLRDIHTVETFLRSPAAVLTLDLIGAMIPLALLFYFGVTFGLIGLAGIVGAVLLGWMMHVATRGYVGEARQRLASSSADLGGQLVHPDLVRGLGMLWPTLIRWQPRYDGALDGMERVRARIGAVEAVESLVFTIYELVLKGFACWLIIQHTGTIALLIAASMLGMMVVHPYISVARSWESWAFALQSWTRVREALTDNGDPPVVPPDRTVPPGLVLEAARFAPPGRPLPIIGDLTLRLTPGSVITVEGPNGVGKSTLLRLVLGLMPPTAGRVLLDGQDTFRCDRATFGARIGYLPQDVQLLDGDVFHNIGRGPGALPDAVVQASRAAGAHEMIARLPLGYQTPSGATSGLSAGQRRLIGLARALYGEPRLLVLDEPEVGMDGYARVAMRSAVNASREHGTIVMIVTHEPDTWRGVADLRLLLSAGGGWQVQPAGDDAAGPDSARTDLAALR